MAFRLRQEPGTRDRETHNAEGGAAISPSWLRKPWIRRRSTIAKVEAPAPGADVATERPVDETLWYLERVNIFADMTPAEMKRLAERTIMRRYVRGNVIVQPDDPPETIYLVKEGRVKLCQYSEGGHEQILALLEHGDIFAERALTGARTQCEAFEDTLICVMRREDFEDLIQSKPALALRVVKMLAGRLRHAEERMGDLAFLSVPGRLAAILVRLAESYGEPHEGGQRLVLRLTHQDLASMIGATCETVTSVLTRFRDEGVIAIDDRHIVIPDIDRLREVTA